MKRVIKTTIGEYLDDQTDKTYSIEESTTMVTAGSGGTFPGMKSYKTTCGIDVTPVDPHDKALSAFELVQDNGGVITRIDIKN
ncbi:hypothetical protein [Pseudoalteromonas rhizosphaerae]|uniref:hypothetical protein n=1 Tax=Pseudoalteromonas rhizosphaerae TaxID=2518973 RepID=UPI00384CA207